MDAFGAFSNRLIGPFGPGMNVVFGRNEAGKTTFAQFVGGVLFGWEETRGQRNTYKPDNAERAGTLFFANEDGTGDSQASRIRNADGLVIPGVGAFYDAIAFMRQSGEADAVLDAVAAGTLLLGICLGLQLFFERGNEGVPADEDSVADGNAPEQASGPWVDGLGLMRGSCTRLESSRLKVPHVGWDQVHMTPAGAADPLLAGFAEGANMYFTHSYAVAGDVDATDVLARTHYTRSFPCIVRHGNVWGCQSHPEKSSALGQRILKNFVNIVEEVGR